MHLNPTINKDYEIAGKSMDTLPDVDSYIEKLELEKDEVIQYGRTPKLDYIKIMDRLSDKKNGKFIEVTAITPTPLGEGKTTTTIGLIQGLGLLGKNAGGCIRQPSGGPTMNIKGSAAGGGNSLIIPMTEFSLGLTGDINDITNAHNLAMTALNARMQHERNYDDEKLKSIGIRRLNIDPENIRWNFVMDFCCQALRKMEIGLGGGKLDGYKMMTKADISVSSELMAILSIAKDLKDLRKRIGNIVLAQNMNGNEITTEDLEVAGAMMAWMRNTINPTLCYTTEHQPCLVHAGPFANIAIGQSSIIGDRLGLKLFDYHVTESGFGADIGYEKFWNVKSRLSKITPDCVVLVATIRAIKMHGGGPQVTAGKPIPKEYTEENIELLKKGAENLFHHAKVIRKSGVNPVICINKFSTDTDREIEILRKMCGEMGYRCAVSDHWMNGGEGALELADAVIEACEDKPGFNYLYTDDMKLKERVELIAREVYGADGVEWSENAVNKLSKYDSDGKYLNYSTMMVKTHLSLSHDPTLKGVPKNWILPITDILEYNGAEFLCPVAGNISMMPGTCSNPAYRNIDVDTNTGEVLGLF